MKILIVVVTIIALSSMAYAASAVDTFHSWQTGLRDPAPHVDAVTPSDTVDIPHVTRKVYVGGAGDLAVIMADGTTVTFKAVPVGSTLEIRVSRVLATGTTATNILGLY